MKMKPKLYFLSKRCYIANRDETKYRYTFMLFNVESPSIVGFRNVMIL